MKNLILSTIILFLFCIDSQSQSMQSFRINLPPGKNRIISLDEMSNIEGSPYLNENWQKGSIVMTSGDTIQSIMLRFNVYKGEMQFQNEEKIYAIGAPEDVKKIVLANQIFVYLTYTKDGKQKKGFFEVLCSGKSNLLVLNYPVILPSNYNLALNSGNKNDQITLKKKYYLKKGDFIVEIDKKGKNVVSSFEKGKEIQKFAKENSLSFKKETDLIEIVKHVNSLN